MDMLSLAKLIPKRKYLDDDNIVSDNYEWEKKLIKIGN